MQPMSANQEYYAAQPAPPYPQPQQQHTKAQMPMEPQHSDHSQLQSPVSSAYPSEMGYGRSAEMHEAPSERYH